MKKRAFCAILSAVMAASACFVAPVLHAESGYRMEYLDRGLIAVKTDDGIYLSWRLLGTETVSTTFDIYRNGEFFTTTPNTNYTDSEGFLFYNYQVVPHGQSPQDAKKASVWNTNYLDVPIQRPENGVIDRTGEVYSYSANDATAADVDGDGEYEIILKWDPSNSKDNSQGGYTGIVYLDCYRLDGTRLWRIDMGKNIRAGAHYTQFIAYDFDGDGCAELAMKTAPGTVDGTGHYVNEKGGSYASNSSDYRRSNSGKYLGQITSGNEYLTMFDGKTGAAIKTIDYKPSRGAPKDWGKDSYGGRSERYLAGVAYLDGTTPSLIMCRGYYQRAAMVAYNWNGSDFTEVWSRDDKSSSSGTIYGQGAHSLSIADVDNDGRDEIIFGSAIVDHNGSVLSNTRLGHGDALHVSDFNNDGNQEIFMVHEETKNAEFHKPDGTVFARINGSNDVGRGVAGNIDANPNKTTSGALFYSVASSSLYDMSGKAVGDAPSEQNFLIYWDGDLSRELLDKNRIVKYNSASGVSRLETFADIHHNNSTKATPSLSADLFGDWREEVVFPVYDDSALRIFTTTLPTDYKIPTLMHDPQYRTAIAWQNVGYNQPPHTSYYIGSESASGNTIAPKSSFKTIYTPPAPPFAPEDESKDYTEELVFSSNSFNSGNMDDFTGVSGKVESIDAPFKNALHISGNASANVSYADTSMQYAVPAGLSIDNLELSENAAAASAKLTNASKAEMDTALIAAGYDEGGALVQVVKQDNTLEPGKTADLSAELTLPHSSQKIMLWDNLAGEKPLCPVLSDAGAVYSAPIDPNCSDLVYKISLMWKPSATGTTYNRLRLFNKSLGTANNNAILLLQKRANGALQYASNSGGLSKLSAIDNSLTASNWYMIDITLDFASQTIDLAVLDYGTPNAETKYVYGIPMHSNMFLDRIDLMNIYSESYVDNFTIKKLNYKAPRNIASFTVTDESGAPVKDAQINFGGRILKTNASGRAQITSAHGNYSYTVSRDKYKSVRGEIALDRDTETNITLIAGETRNVYLHYVNTNGLQIAPDTIIGEGVENTAFTISESAKGDITYTFTDDDFTSEDGDEDITDETHKPGDTVVYEYDADNSNSGKIRIAEGSDTIVTFVYKEKRVPVPGLDTEILRINMSEDGYGQMYVNKGSTEYVSDSRKYLRVPGIENNNLTINLPSGQTKFVMEFDMLFENLDFGGNYFGFTPYSGTTAGESISMRTTSTNTNQWHWVYGTKENYLTYENGTAYPSAWKNKWAHIILVSDGTGVMNVTIANTTDNIVYVQDFPVTMLNAVGTSAKPVTKLVFSRNSGTGSGTIGFANFKAYNVGAASGGSLVETNRTVTIPGSSSFRLDTATHISDAPGVDYSIAGLIGAAYELWDGNNNPVTANGVSLSSDGTLTVTTPNIDGQYKVAVLINGVARYVYNLSFKVRTPVFVSSFTSNTDGFAAGKGSNTTISASGGTLSFRADAANGGREFYKQLDEPITSGVVDIEYLFNTGGTKDSNNAWNWSGREYEFALQFLDGGFNAAENAAAVNSGAADTAPSHLLMEVSQAYTTSAQDTKFRTFSSGQETIRSKWTKLTSGSASVLNRSVTRWIVSAHIDLDNKMADFSIRSNENDYDSYEIKGVSIANTNGFGTLRFLARKNGSSVTWAPQLSNVTIYNTK